jgi:hypothetical protein
VSLGKLELDLLTAREVLVPIDVAELVEVAEAT